MIHSLRTIESNADPRDVEVNYDIISYEVQTSHCESLNITAFAIYPLK